MNEIVSIGNSNNNNLIGGCCPYVHMLLNSARPIEHTNHLTYLSTYIHSFIRAYISQKQSAAEEEECIEYIFCLFCFQTLKRLFLKLAYPPSFQPSNGFRVQLKHAKVSEYFNRIEATLRSLLPLTNCPQCSYLFAFLVTVLQLRFHRLFVTFFFLSFCSLLLLCPF